MGSEDTGLSPDELPRWKNGWEKDQQIVPGAAAACLARRPESA